ncbi:glycosyltransferase [Bermanella sp. WJH001]|uniref:glycosyltransferase n=1 Tax=Bermanella sp. WJH001 TaxID=3048005 RepID=UPI0024BEAEA2|nr:glycosyltransferase [Bermanella sp. WJH001]MDJ1539174.1 glycosyltransferase [Bermanella sp. WJH001]
MKTLLIIGYVWPEPNSSAAGARMLQLIECFQQDGYRIEYASPAALSEHAIDYQAVGITTANIELNNSSFDEYLTQLNPDAVMFDRFMMEEQFGWRVEKHCPQALRILDSEDLHCLRFARQALAKNNHHVIKEVPNSALFSDHAKREIAAIYRCDLTLTISQYEMDLLQNTFNVPASILQYVPFMLKDVQVNTDLSFHTRQHFVSIGNFRHEPNWDAVLQLKQHIWPLIRKQLPQAQLHIFGAYPPKKATQLHNEKQGFLIKGWCEDAFKELSQARVLLAPLRFGAGLKGKMIDAAQCGLPAVTTSIGAEGLFAHEGLITAHVSDNFDEFSSYAVDLYNNEHSWLSLQNQCESFLNTGFAWEIYSAQLIERLHDIKNNLETHRLNNFTGSMLRHHTMKSTQYMAQWIEAKNKV